MQFTIPTGNKTFHIEHCYVAGWTGRDSAAVEHHINELAAIGIAPPSTVPLYYRVTNALLTQSATIEVLGDKTSGEIEPLLIKQQGELWIGLASDHTDRELEAYSVAASKQACLKPSAKELWRYSDVKAHSDALIMRCSIKENNQWVTYQEGSLSSIRPLDELIEGSKLQDNSAMLCGTLSAIGGVRPATEYKMELVDPELNKTIQLAYTVNVLPIIN